jgi:hypothetical protein
VVKGPLLAKAAPLRAAGPPVLFPDDNDSPGRAAGRAHLGRDQAPLRGLMAELHDSYEEGIALLASDHADSDES